MPANTAKTLARAGAGVVTRGGGRRQPSEHPQAGAVSVGNRFTDPPLASAATSHASAGGVTFAERTSSMPAVAAERPAALGVRAAARVLSHPGGTDAPGPSRRTSISELHSTVADAAARALLKRDALFRTWCDQPGGAAERLRAVLQHRSYRAGDHVLGPSPSAARESAGARQQQGVLFVTRGAVLEYCKVTEHQAMLGAGRVAGAERLLAECFRAGLGGGGGGGGGGGQGSRRRDDGAPREHAGTRAKAASAVVEGLFLSRHDFCLFSAGADAHTLDTLLACFTHKDGGRTVEQRLVQRGELGLGRAHESCVVSPRSPRTAAVPKLSGGWRAVQQAMRSKALAAASGGGAETATQAAPPSGIAAAAAAAAALAMAVGSNKRSTRPLGTETLTSAALGLHAQVAGASGGRAVRRTTSARELREARRQARRHFEATAADATTTELTVTELVVATSPCSRKGSEEQSPCSSTGSLPELPLGGTVSFAGLGGTPVAQPVQPNEEEEQSGIKWF